MKVLLIALTVVAALGLQTQAFADYATTPQPHPHYGHYPYPAPQYQPPYYPPQYPPHYGGNGTVTCYAQGLANGALFYGVGLNVYSAQQWALYACNSTGQYCQITGCRY